MPISRRSFLKTVSVGAGSLPIPSLINADAQNEKKQPNIIVILADDMGFSDAGSFGGEIHTPNIDRIAKNGIRFTNFYNCARCCPTRASLMTGLYPHQVGLAKNGQNLSRNGVTIAEALQSTNYDTAMSGKWHLSRTKPLDDKEKHQRWLDHQYDPEIPFSPIETYPINRGFDEYYGNIWGVVNFFDPFSLVEGETPIKDVPKDYYITDAINNKAVEYINSSIQRDNPFFLYLSHCAPHWPLHALQEDIEKYKNRYINGWDHLRQERYQRMLELGLFDQHNTPLPPVQVNGKTWDELSASEKEYQANAMAAHAAMVDRMDQGIGKVLNTLEKKGELENTIIFFLSDNGASPEVPKRPGYDRSSQTREGKEIRYSGFDAPGSETTYTGFGPGWASACNTPFRYWKAQSFEGGCHTPLIVSHPNMMSNQKGSITEQTSHVMDIMPTCLDLTGASYPTSYQSNEILPLEGKSLLPILRGKQRSGHKSIFFEHEKSKAVIHNDWKLVANKSTPDTWELYHLKNDRTEMNNIAVSYPEVVKKLSDEWNNWAKRMHLV